MNREWRCSSEEGTLVVPGINDDDRRSSRFAVEAAALERFVVPHVVVGIYVGVLRCTTTGNARCILIGSVM